MRSLTREPLRRASRAAQLGAILCLTLASCTSASLEVRQSAEPNPFVGVQSFALEPVQYVDLTVDGKPEPDYIAGLEADSAVKWKEDLVRINEIFALAVQNASEDSLTFEDAAPYRVRPVVSTIESGYYRIPAWNAVTRIYMTVQVTNAAGEVADELFLGDSAAFDALMNPTVGGRLGSVAKALGNMLGNYLEERVEE